MKKDRWNINSICKKSALKKKLDMDIVLQIVSWLENQAQLLHNIWQEMQVLLTPMQR